MRTLIALSLALASVAAAEPIRSSVAEPAPPVELACQRSRHPGLAEGPVVIGLYDAELGTARRACLRSELALYERMGATLDLPSFYGGVRADTVLSGSLRLRPYLEIFGALELVRYEFAQNATIKASALGLGQLSMGLQGLMLERRRFVVSAYGRLLLPTASASASVQTTGAELGLAGSYRPRRDLDLHAGLSADFSAGLSAGPAQVRGGAALTLGLQYAPATWFALAVDLQAVLGHRAVLDGLLPQLALRFRLWRALGLELAGTQSIAGADRRLAIGVVRVGYRY